MTTQQLILVVGAIALGVIALLAASLAWRALTRAGAGLRAMEASTSKAVLAMPRQMASVRAALGTGDSLTERALWSLTRADERIDALSANMKARRDASDRLRARLIGGKSTLSRLRETVRALMRLNDIRRNFWA